MEGCRGPRFGAPQESTSSTYPSGMEVCMGPASAACPGSTARLDSESSRGQVGSSSKHVLPAACRPELLLRLDQLQQEIEARGGHVVLESLELSSDGSLGDTGDVTGDTGDVTGDTGDSSKASPTAATPRSDYTVLTSLPPKSPAWQTWRVNNQRRHLRASPSVPARLDSGLQTNAASTAAVRDGSPYSGFYGQDDAGKRRGCAFGVADTVAETVAIARPRMSSDAIPCIPVATLPKRSSHNGMSARRRLPVNRHFRSSSNLDLSGEPFASTTGSSSTTAGAGGADEICRAAEKISGVRSSTGMTTSIHSPQSRLVPSARRGDTQPRAFSRSTDKRVSAQTAALNTIPSSVTSTCVEHHQSPTPHALRTNFSGGVTAAKRLESLMPFPAVVARSASFAEKPSPQGNLIAGNYSAVESAGVAGPPGHRYVKSYGGSVNSGEYTPTNEDATFSGTFSVCRRVRVFPHARSTGGTCVAERKDSNKGKSAVPTAPTPSPHQLESQGGIFGSSPPRQQVDCVSTSPRQRILGVRYSSVTDRFHISREKIGEGGSGEIRKCLEWSSGKVFACKTIHKSNIKSKRQAYDLRTEVLLLDLLKVHDGVVRIHEVFEDPKAIHLVMELCHGGDLFDFIQNAPKRRLPERQAAAVLRQLLHSLNHCHSLGVIHRDVKPENILLCDKVASETAGTLELGPIKVKLSDFGVAGFLDPDGVCLDPAGTSEYMAPEMARKAAYNAKADIWSAGVVLYAMLSGSLPAWASLPDALRGQGQASGTDDGQRKMEGGRTMQEAITEEKQVSLRSKVWKEVTDEAKDLLKGMLEKDPQKRLSAAEALGHPWLDGSR